MIGFILRKWRYLEKEFGTYRDGFNNWKDKMRTHFKNKRGRMGSDIPEVTAKREIEKEALQVMAWQILKGSV